jgi:thioredoxin reductase (NADPH)
MSDDPGDASMFDYDARPVTPQIVLVGERASSVGYAIRDFLSRIGFPYEWVDVENRARVDEVLAAAELDSSRLPVCVLPDGTQLAPASVQGVAAGLGMMLPPSLSSAARPAGHSPSRTKRPRG